MGSVSELLGRVAYEFALVQPLIPTYLHVLLSAIFSIYTGAHASLSVPSSAAKPAKRTKHTEDDEEEITEEAQQKMEGLSPVDAIMFPVLAGCTLAGLYFLIKWLEDPALLNKILNWYFSVFGILSVARLLTDSTAVVTSYVFPAIYTTAGQAWKIDQERRKAESVSANPVERDTPLPGLLSKLGLSPKIIETLWTLREFPSNQLHVHAYVHKLFEARFRIGPQGFSGLLLALVAVLYFNLIDKPWWLTNILGLSFSYSALQIMSPTTFWTGTMILASLFLYDIYFVFFTPLMVTVAKSLDIPIKLLFPRPPGPTDDVNKQSLAMLGLGDIVLPGIMIGLALRFDLYLFYLRKQTRQVAVESKFPEKENGETDIIRAKWHPAAGGWGERFWFSGGVKDTDVKELGGLFPKTYFHASIVGYTLGMLTTLGIMQVFGHAQPALLYLVPCVLGSLWGTAFFRREVNLMWQYNEATDEEQEGKGSGGAKGIESIFSPSRQEKIVKRIEVQAKERVEVLNVGGEDKEEPQKPANDHKSSLKKRNDLIFFSISLPQIPRSRPESEHTSSKLAMVGTQPSVEDELRVASSDGLDSRAILNSTIHRRLSGTINQGEPAEKRQRRE